MVRVAMSPFPFRGRSTILYATACTLKIADSAVVSSRCISSLSSGVSVSNVSTAHSKHGDLAFDERFHSRVVFILQSKPDQLGIDERQLLLLELLDDLLGSLEDGRSDGNDAGGKLARHNARMGAFESPDSLLGLNRDCLHAGMIGDSREES